MVLRKLRARIKAKRKAKKVSKKPTSTPRPSPRPGQPGFVGPVRPTPSPTPPSTPRPSPRPGQPGFIGPVRPTPTPRPSPRPGQPGFIGPVRPTPTPRPSPRPGQPRKPTLKFKQISPISLKRRISDVKKTEQFIKVKRILGKKLTKFKQSPKVKKIKKVTGSKKKQLNKDQENLNKDVEEFNKLVGGKKLSQESFDKAQKISEGLNKRQKEINEGSEKLKKSRGTKIKKFLFGEDFVEHTPEQKENLKKNIKELGKKIEDRKEKGKSTFIKKRTLKGLEQELEAGGIRLLKGEVPITPIGTFAGLGKVTQIKFIGKQKTIGNRIVTDIVFVEKSGKRVGLARGITLIKGKKGLTVVAGKTGVPGIKFPSAKPKIGRVRSFLAREISVTRPSKTIIKTKIDLLRRGKKVGQIKTIKKNLEAVDQLGVGQIISVKGQRFIKTGVKFPSGKGVRKISRGIKRDTFASLSATFTKNDISKIIGKTITSKGVKVKFIGFIRGERGAKGLSGLSSGQKLQFKKALSKVISASASSLSQAGKFGKVSKNVKLATASAIITTKQIIKTIPKARVTSRARVTQRQVQRQVFTPKQIIKLKENIKRGVRQGSRGLQRLRQQPKTKLTGSGKQKLIQQSKQVEQLKQAQKLVLKQIKKAKAITPRGPITIPRISKVLKLLAIPLPRRKKRIIVKKTPTKKKAHNVFARPLKRTKKGRRPKLIRVNKVPLSKRRAKDLRNFITDTSLSRTARIKPTKGKPGKSRLRVPKGFSKRTSRKFRRFRVIKGKRVALPKGKVIERSRHLLDTHQEKKQITLKRRIAQITKPKKKKLSSAQLNALSKGREKRARNLKKR